MNGYGMLKTALIASTISISTFAPAQAQSASVAGISVALDLPFLRTLRSSPSSGGDRELRSVSGASEWINSRPLSSENLRGKVVLIDFWTYTCINWIRTAPYIRAWAEKYKDQGLVVIGVHTPEFEFEKNVANVRQAVQSMKLTYPVAVDSDFTIWRGFANNAWPALYFVDAHGRVRHHHLGEGEYERSEMMIQKLLTEAGAANVNQTPVSVVGQGAEAAADWRSLKSPETYIGYGRADKFASVGRLLMDNPRVYTAPAKLTLNQWALAGDWTVRRELAGLNKANGRVAHRFHARDVHLVMGPAAGGAPVRFRVLIDGQPPRAAHGVDVDAQGNGMLREQRMYQLIRQAGRVSEHTIEIEFLDPGAELFAFTFG